jgi:hypothetical protein
MDTELLSKKFGQMGARVNVDSVSNVVNAKEALQPLEVKAVVNRRIKRVKDRLRRKNKAFVRQRVISSINFKLQER